jgi:hypothetical protein
MDVAKSTFALSRINKKLIAALTSPETFVTIDILFHIDDVATLLALMNNSKSIGTRRIYFHFSEKFK